MTRVTLYLLPDQPMPVRSCEGGVTGDCFFDPVQAADIISLTQQLQLLHVTKDFQQLVKSSRTNKPTGSSSNATAAAAAGGGDSGGQSAAATEVQRLQKLLQVICSSTNWQINKQMLGKRMQQYLFVVAHSLSYWTLSLCRTLHGRHSFRWLSGSW